MLEERSDHVCSSRSGAVAAAALLFTWRVMMSAPRLLNKELRPLYSTLCIYWMDGQHLYPERINSLSFFFQTAIIPEGLDAHQSKEKS